MTNSINLIRGNNGTNLASSPTVTTLRTPGSTTILVNTIVGIPANFIAEMGTPSLETGLIANGVVFKGHVLSDTLIIDSIGVGYTDAGSAVNDIIVLKPTAEWANNIANTLEVSHNDDGTLNNAAVDDLKAGLEAATDFRTQIRQSSTISTATLTPNIDTANLYDVTAQAAAITIANPTGTPVNGDVIIVRIKDDGTARAITYGANFENISGLDSITTTVANKTSIIGSIWNSATSKWQIVSLSTGV